MIGTLLLTGILNLVPAQTVEPTCELAIEVRDAVDARVEYLVGEFEKTDNVVERMLLDAEINGILALRWDAGVWWSNNCSDE